MSSNPQTKHNSPMPGFQPQNHLPRPCPILAPSPLQTLNAVFSALSKLSSTTDSLHSTATNTASPLPEAARPYLLTLHVLFPHCLLDALDLLDRACVTRVVIQPDTGKPINYEANAPPQSVTDPAATHTTTADPMKTTPPARVVGYDVAAVLLPPPAPISASAHAPPTAVPAAPAEHSGGEGRSRGPDRRRYAAPPPFSTQHHQRVHLSSWNCTCAAFAFAAYGHGGGGDGSRVANGTFGGLSLCGAGEAEGRGVRRERLPPVCKHLLACVLGEICPGLFGGSGGDAEFEAQRGGDGARGVVERTVSVQEAAGWVGGGML